MKISWVCSHFMKLPSQKLQHNTKRHPTFHAFSVAVLVCITATVCLVSQQTPVSAQAAPCGIVEGIDYPIDITDTLEGGFDDFALFRARFGGLHAGIDIGFNRRGEPVRAAARGRVTYSDINGWDTEKGVVIVEHIFPDGSLRYSLYGHMEQSDSYFFPLVGTCVERGTILGTIGWPSRGLPHLHFEIRDFLPNDGGPGYAQVNPLSLGWYHPLDFTLLWRARLNPATTGYAAFRDFPRLPPVLMDNGLLVIAHENRLAAYAPPTTPLWDIQMDGIVTGLLALPGGRVIAHSQNGQAIQIQGGRIVATWSAPGRSEPLVSWNEIIAFVTPDGGIATYTPMGEPLWVVDGDGDGGRIVGFQAGTAGFAIAHRLGGITRWRAVDAMGNVVWDQSFERTPLFTPSSEGWLILDGMDVLRIDARGSNTLASTGVVSGRASALITDVFGTIYIYASDRNRTFLALNADGSERWRTQYPVGVELPPLMDVGGGCLLYTLDDDGMLNAFSTADGSLVNQLQLYAGGVQNNHPQARLLVADASDQVLLGSGFLSMLAVNGAVLGGAAFQDCLLG